MKYYLTFLLAVAILGGALGFQMATPGVTPAALRSFTPRSSLAVERSPWTDAGARRATGRKHPSLVVMQLGGDGGGPIERGTMPTYEEEQGGEQEFFKTDLDKRPDAEKVKDPLVLITLGWIVGMFLVATVFIIGGVN